MKLAAHLGMTLAECRHRMGASEFALWQAHMEIDPIGDDREDWRNANIVQAILATNPHRRSSDRVPKLIECKLNFMVDQADPADQYGKLEAWARQHNRQMEMREQKHRQKGQ